MIKTKRSEGYFVSENLCQNKDNRDFIVVCNTDQTFLQIGNQEQSLRLYKGKKETLKEFTEKMKKIKEVISNFVDNLEEDINVC